MLYAFFLHLGPFSIVVCSQSTILNKQTVHLHCNFVTAYISIIKRHEIKIYPIYFTHTLLILW